MIDFFSDLYSHSGVSNQYEERAAFLVRDTHGNVQCLEWPRTNQMRAESFKGSIPLQTVALVHSHPAMDRLPTQHDMDLARALHLPMIVLTQSNVAIFDPDSGTTTFPIENRNWVPRHIDERCETGWLAQ